MWGFSIQFWQAIVSWANIIALICGAMAVTAAFASAFVSSKVSDVVQEDANRRIAVAHTQSQVAISETARANEKIAVLNVEAQSLKTEAEKANAEIAVAQREVAKANERSAQLEIKTEQLRKENLDLESSLSPRILKDQGGTARALAPFAPIKAVIEYLPEIECKRTAGQIEFVLSLAKWEVSPAIANPKEILFFDGVIVRVNAAGVVPEEVRRASIAAEALVSELNKTGIKSRILAADPQSSSGIVVIRVGMKPNPAMERIILEIKREMGISEGPTN